MEDGTRVLAVGLAAFALVAGLAALVAGAQALHRRMAETADDVPALRALGLEPRRLHHRRGPLFAADHRGRRRAGRRARDRWLVADADRSGEEGRAQPRDRRRCARAGDRRAAARAPARCERGLRSAARHSDRPGRIGSDASTARARPCSRAAGSRRPASSGSRWPSTQARVGPRVPVRSAIVGAAFGVAGVVAAVTFGAGLDGLVEDPTSSGWNWTLAPDLAEEDTVRAEGRRRRRGHRDRPLRPGGGGRRAHDRRLHAGGAGRAIVQRRARPHAVRSRRDRARSEDGRPPRPRASETSSPSLTQLRPTVSVRRSLVGEVLMPTMDDNAFNEGIAMTPDALAAVAQTEGFDQPVVRFADGIDEDEAARRVQDRLPEAISVYSFSSPPPDVANLTRRAVPATGARAVPRSPRHRGRRPRARLQRAPSQARPGSRAVRRLRGQRRPSGAHGPVVDARGHRPGLRHPARHRAGPGVLAARRRADRGASHARTRHRSCCSWSPWSPASRRRPCRCHPAWRRRGSARWTHCASE